MSTTSVNIRVDTELKKAAESLFETWQNGAEDLKRLCRI